MNLLNEHLKQSLYGEKELVDKRMRRSRVNCKVVGLAPVYEIRVAAYMYNLDNKLRGNHDAIRTN